MITNPVVQSQQIADTITVLYDAEACGITGEIGANNWTQQVISTNTSGTEDTYFLPTSIYNSETLSIFVGGAKQIEGIHFSLLGSVIKFNSIVPGGKTIEASYIQA
jgi:hypothetical protein